MLGLPRGTEWIVILLIVILLFGPGRIGKIAGELGRSITAFRDGLAGGKNEEEAPASETDAPKDEEKK